MVLGVGLYVGFVGLVGAALLTAAFKLGNTYRRNRDMLSGFECGFQSISSARTPFSLKFYLLSIIFLLFDVELVLVLPFFISSISGMGVFLFLFFSVLLWGLVHECNENSIEWGE